MGATQQQHSLFSLILTKLNIKAISCVSLHAGGQLERRVLSSLGEKRPIYVSYKTTPHYKKYSLPPMLKSFIFEPKVVEQVCVTDSGRWVAGYRRRPDFSSSRQSVDTLQSTRNLYWWVAWPWLLLLTNYG